MNSDEIREVAKSAVLNKQTVGSCVHFIINQNKTIFSPSATQVNIDNASKEIEAFLGFVEILRVELREEMIDTVMNDVETSLTNAVENGYDHDFYRNPREYVLEILEQAGIRCLSVEDAGLMMAAEMAVRNWRMKNK